MATAVAARALHPRAAHADSVIAGVDPLEFSTANPLRLFIIQATIIIAFARVLAYGLAKLKQPTVIAEVIGGIILGPTVMGRIPHFSEHVFPLQSLPYLNLVSSLGLTLFLFLVGLEVDLRVMRKTIKVSGAISFVGLAVPFAAGAGLAKGIYDNFVNQQVISFGHFALFVGVATSITAFPVLARILTETKLLYTQVGVTTLAAGVGNDVVGWILLALTVALVNASSGLIALYALLCTLAWTLVLFLAIRPAFVWLARRTGSLDSGGPTQLMITVTLLLVLLSAWITDIIGVHAIFGAFLVGLMVPHEGGLAVAFTEKIEDLVAVIFLPIYFTLSGLKTNLGYLSSGRVWAYTIAITLVAFASKFVGCAVTAKLCRFNNRESAAIGTLMACKGLVELIVLNIGLSAGVLNTQTFSMFVLMAIITTVVTTPLTLWIYPERHRKAFEDDATTHSHLGHAAAGKFVSQHGKESSSDDKAGPQWLDSKRVMVVLSSFEHLSSLMSFVQLVRPSHSRITVDESGEPNETAQARDKSGSTNVFRRRANQAQRERSRPTSTAQESLDEKYTSEGSTNENSNELRSDAPYASHLQDANTPLSFDALRLVELTDRTSAVMRVAENEDTLRADPITNVFRTFTQLNRMPVRAAMSVVGPESFSSTIASRARNFASDLIILPWAMPAISNSAETGNGGIVSALVSPFDGLFARGTAGAATTAPGSSAAAARLNAQHSVLARKLMQTAECDVGLLVTPTLGAESNSTNSATAHLPTSGHIVLAFMGGPDDRVALDLLVHFCATNTDLRATVLHFKRSTSASEIGEANQASAGVMPTVPPTVHHHTRSTSQADGLTAPPMPGLTIHDTMYHTSGHGGGSRDAPLQSLLQDDLAIQRLRDAPRLAEALGSERLRIETVETARPLTDLLLRIQMERPSLVITGRGRRSPTMGSHREELRVLLALGLDEARGTSSSGDAAASSSRQPFYESTTRLINGDSCKVVGETAYALHAVVTSTIPQSGSHDVVTRGVSTPAVLVVASGHNTGTSRADGGEDADVEQQ